MINEKEISVTLVKPSKPSAIQQIKHRIDLLSIEKFQLKRWLFLWFWSIFLFYFPFQLTFPPTFIPYHYLNKVRLIFNMNGARMGGFLTEFHRASTYVMMMIHHINKAHE